MWSMRKSTSSRYVGPSPAGTGQEIVLPEFLKEYRPDTAIVMNPIYIPEIQAKLDELGVPTQLLSIESVLDG